MTKLTVEEKCVLMFSLGQSTGRQIKQSKDKDMAKLIEDCPYHKLAQKLADADVFVQKKEEK